MRDSFALVEPPQSLDDERAVLGSILLAPTCLADAQRTVGSASFYHPAHRIIFDACLHLYDSDVAIDARTLHNELIRTEKLDAIGGPDYLASLLEVVPSAANVEHYAAIVRDKSVLRAIIRTAYEMLRGAHDAGADADNVLAAAQAAIAAISKGRSAGASVPWTEAARALVEWVEEVREGKVLPKIPTGYLDLDKIVGGFAAGQLIIIAGRPSQGKTSFGTNLAVRFAAKQRRPVAIFSLEMSQYEVSSSIMCLHTGIPADVFADPREATPAQLTTIRCAADTASDVPLWIDNRTRDLVGIRAELRRYARQHGVQVAFIDYLQLIDTPSGGRGQPENRTGEIEMITRTLKNTAAELGIVVVALSQLSRTMEHDRREPQLRDLKSSGAIEEDANMVLMLHRPYEADPTDSAVKVFVRKHRGGRTGEAALIFLRSALKFVDGTWQKEEVRR